MVKPIGKLSIKAMIANMKPKSVKLFPRDRYPVSESVRARCGEAMKGTDLHFVTSNEPEGTYVIRLR